MKSRLLRCVFFVLALQPVCMPAAASNAQPTLRDYDGALRSNDLAGIRILRGYIQGAVDTHLHYAKRLKNWTSFNALCTGNSQLTAQELGSALEMKIISLQRRYGEDIMGMPIVEVIPSIVEEHYRCF